MFLRCDSTLLPLQKNRLMVKSGLYASTKRKSSTEYWLQQRVLIAGGTSGFGLVLAKLLSRLGASVMVIGRSAERLRTQWSSARSKQITLALKNSSAGIRDLSRNGEATALLLTVLKSLVVVTHSFSVLVNQVDRLFSN